MKKILLIDVNCKNSSTGKIVYDLYKEINTKENYEAAICYGRGKKINEFNIYKFSSNLEVHIHALLSRITGLTGFFSPIATFKLIKYIRKFKPDVVHLHELHGYFVNINPLVNFLKKNRIKTVWTFHCEFMYTGKCGHAYECEKWKTNCEKCPKIKEYPKSLFFDCTNRMFRNKKKMFKGFENLIIVTPSEWLKNRVKESFLKDYRVDVIHNGVDTKIFKKQQYEDLIKRHNLIGKKIILSVAPDIMSNRKGGNWIVKLAKEINDKNIVFILIGVENLKENFPENVIALGRTENQLELAKYYNMADLFLICSEKETFSMTCAEAISCGTKVIGFKSGAPETIYSEAIFVEYGNLKKLKEVVEEYLYTKDFDECDERKENKSAENVQKKYSKEKMISNYFKVY